MCVFEVTSLHGRLFFASARVMLARSARAATKRVQKILIFPQPYKIASKNKLLLVDVYRKNVCLIGHSLSGFFRTNANNYELIFK